MIIITKKGNVYKWNYMRLLKHLSYIAFLIFFIASYLVLGTMDYNIKMGG